MANVIRLKRASGSDPAASDLVSGEPAVRTDTGELFFKKDDGSIAKVAGAGGGPDFKYLALRNAANNGAASYPNADFTLVTSGTTSAIVPTAANTLLVSVNGVIQKPNTGTSTPSQGFALSGSTIKFGANISAAPDFILYQESGGIGEPSDETVSEAKLQVSNSPINGYFLSAQSGNTGGLTWAAPVATSCTGNSATATALATARTINGTSFDGTANITVTAAAGTLTGNTLNSSVVTSSLTSLGDLSGLTVNGDMSLTGANYNVLWDKSDNALEFGDSAKAVFGTGSDLQIYHNSGFSYIDAQGDQLRIEADQLRVRSDSGESYIEADANSAVKLYFDNSKKFETTSAGVQVTGNLAFGDNGKASFGASGDLQIFHNGSNSLINDLGTGGVIIAASKTNIMNASAGENMAVFNDNDSVELYYDGTKKIETKSWGLKVYGDVSLEDSEKFLAGASNDLQLYHNGSNSFIDNHQGDLFIRGDSDNIVIQPVDGENAIQCDPNGSVRLYHDNSQKMLTTSTGINVDFRIAASGDENTYVNMGSPADTFQFYTGGQDRLFITGGPSDAGAVQIRGDNNKLQLGASQDLELFFDGTHSRLIHTPATGDLVIQSDDIYLTDENGGEYYFRGTKNGAAELYYDNSKKLATASDGITVYGRIAADELDMGDDEQIKLGAGDDLRFYHSGSHGILNNITGSFQVQDAGTEKFRVSGTGTSFKDDIFIANDSDKINIGAGNDLQMYHDGSHTYADNTTGFFHIRSNSAIRLQKIGGEPMIYAIPDGAVELYYDQSKRFETTSTGIAVTGHSSTFAAGANAVVATFSSAFGGAGATTVIRLKMNTSSVHGIQIQQAGSATAVAGGNHAATFFNTENAKLRLGTNNTEKFRIEANGDLKGTDTSIGSLSDSRLKKNIVDFTYDLSKFKQFKPRKFDWINPELHGDKSDVRGFVAQEIETVDSTLVGNYELYDETLTDKNPDLAIIEADDGTNIAKDSKLGTNDAMYISVIQQMLAKIETLETKVAALEAK